MTYRVKITAVGFWHVHAFEYANYAKKHPLTELVAVWDDDPIRGAEAARSLGVPFEPDQARALDMADAITLTTATTQHTQIATTAAKSGKHIFAEKLLAPTVEECEAIIGAAGDAGAKVQVSLPRLYHGSTSTIMSAIRGGVCGRISFARVRLSHHGASAGWLTDRFFDPAEAIGGALSDLGCHPVYLAQLFLGVDVQAVTASYGYVTGRAVEDNAVVTLEYADGRLGVCETGFVTRADPFAIEVYGTDAAIRFSAGDTEVTVIQPGNKRSNIPLDADSPPAFEQWIDHIFAGTAPADNLTRAVALTRIVAAANIAAATGLTQRFDV